MKDFIFRLNHFIHKIAVLINTPPPRPARISPHCTNINMLLMHLCDFDSERYSYILKWLAYPLRHPGAKMRYGLVVKGERGTGLSLFFKHVTLLLHEGAARAIGAEALATRFNHGWASAPLVVIDGISPHAIEHVKSLITCNSVVIEHKGEPAKWVPNRTNFIFLSGHVDAIPTGTDRRFMVLEAPPAREKVFYQAIASEIENGGADAFLSFLLHGIDMDGFNETTVPPGFARADPSEVRAGSLHLVQESA